MQRRENHIVQIERAIEQVDIKGQYIQLAKPIHLSGQLNITELLAQYSIHPTQSLPSLTLQIGVNIQEKGRSA